MKASGYERELAQTNGVTDPPLGAADRASKATTAPSPASCSSARALEGGKLVGDGAPFRIEADMVFTRDRPDCVERRRVRRERRSKLQGGRIVVDEERRTSLPKRLGRRRLRRRRPRPDGRRGRGRQARGAIDHRGAAGSGRLHPRSWRECDGMVDLRIELPRHQVAQPVLARLGAADRPQDQCRARLPRRLGRRGVEDARRGRAADRQRLRPALRRDPRPGPAPDRASTTSSSSPTAISRSTCRRSSRSSANGPTARWSSR